MCHKLEPLHQLLGKVHTDLHGIIYMQGEPPWTVHSPGLIYYTDGFGTLYLEDEMPDFMQKHDLRQAISTDRAEDAIYNAFNQKEQPTWDELAACFTFHCLRSGYLDLSQYHSDWFSEMFADSKR